MIRQRPFPPPPKPNKKTSNLLKLLPSTTWQRVSSTSPQKVHKTMGTQPELCSFSYQHYLEKVRPAFQSLLLGDVPQWIDRQYHDSLTYQKMIADFQGICPKAAFSECSCFSQDLLMHSNADTACLNTTNWHDSRFIRFFEKVLLDECILQHTPLSKGTLYIYTGNEEEFAELGLEDDVFHSLLQKLCNRWQGTWIDVDRAGVGGYLTPQETQQLQQKLTTAIAANQGQSFYYDTSELLAHLQEIEAVAATAVSTNNGLLWAQDLLSVYWR